MKTKQKIKIAVDLLMTIALLLLMPYEMTGEAAHEWIGAGMFLLFIIHHILNRKWTGNLVKGRYTPMRAAQTVLVILILICMLGSMVSGIILSRHLFAFLDIRGLSSQARVIHMTCAYWGFVLMSLHLGIHWGIMTGMAGKLFKQPARKAANHRAFGGPAHQPHLHLIRLLPHNAAHPGGSSPGESDFAVLRLFMDMPRCLCVEA